MWKFTALMLEYRVGAHVLILLLSWRHLRSLFLHRLDGRFYFGLAPSYKFVANVFYSTGSVKNTVGVVNLTNYPYLAPAQKET